MEQAESHLAKWLAADEAVANGQSYAIGTRQMTRTHAAEIRRNIDYWTGWVNKLSRSTRGVRVRYGVKA